MFSDKWQHWFVGLARYIATASKDPSTKVGCVVVGKDKEVLSTGFNGLPRGIADTNERLEVRELKYQLVVHAEENALLHAARIGVSLRDGYLFSTFAPCTRCTVSIIQTGITSVAYPLTEVPERWKADMAQARALLLEAAINIWEVPEHAAT